MASTAPYSVAPDDPNRVGILERGPLAAVLVTAVLGLVLVFPKEDLLYRLKNHSEADTELTISYLRNVLRAEQQDLALHLLLAEKLAAKNAFGDAQRALVEAKPYALGGDAAAAWKQADLSVAWQAYHWQVAQGRGIESEALTSARLAVRDRVRAQIQIANRVSELFQLFGQAQGLEDVPAARAALQRLGTHPSLGFADSSRVAREQLGYGDFEQAAKLYFLAKTKTSDGDARTRMADLGVRTLLAANLPEQAYRAAVREYEAAAGGAIHWELANLALAAGLPDRAAKHVRDVVQPNWSVARLTTLTQQQLRKVQDVAFAAGDLAWVGTVLRARVAQNQQLRQPEDLGLREQIAQVTEWAGMPQEALGDWLALAKTSASKQALDQVLRLSPMLNEDEALIWAYRQRQTQGKLTSQDELLLLDIFERVGRPQDAVAWLDAQLQRATRHSEVASLLARRARVLVRMAKYEEAISNFESWAGVVESSGGAFPREDAIVWANLHLRRSQFAQALHALSRYTARNSADPRDKLYWDIRADVAYSLGNADDAMQSWRALLAIRLTQLAEASATPIAKDALALNQYQAERYLLVAAERLAPDEMFALAEALYTSTPADGLLYVWTDLLSANPTAERLAVLNASLTSADRSRLYQSPVFLPRMAGLNAATGSKRLALTQYQQAVALGADANYRLAYWWLLVDIADAKLLRQALMAERAELSARPEFWEVLAASHMQLSEPRLALHFYGKIAADASQNKANDYLWLANFADVLEQTGEASMALRVRRQVHLLLNATVAEIRAKTGALNATDAQALLVKARTGGFRTAAEHDWALQRLGQIAMGTEQTPALRQQADSLLLSKALAGDRIEWARRWLWQRQAQRESGQNYVRLAVALTEGDQATLDALMETSARQFQAIDRHNALRQLGRGREALAVAVQLSQAGESPKNEELQQSIDALTREQAKRVRVTTVSQSNKAVAVRGVRAKMDAPFSPALRMSLDMARLRYSQNGADLRDSPVKAGANVALSEGQLQVAANYGGAVNARLGVALKFSRDLAPGVLASLAVQSREPSTDSSLLQVAGVQSGASVQASWQAAPDLRLEALLGAKRYATQHGTNLGQSIQAQAGASYALRRGYPDWTVNLQVQRVIARASGSVDSATQQALRPWLAGSNATPQQFVGEPTTSIAASLGYGLSQRADDSPGPQSPYARRLRPYGELGVRVERSSLGSGVSPVLRLGARGAVLGPDQLSVEWETKPAGTATSQLGNNKEWKVFYEYMGF